MRLYALFAVLFVAVLISGCVDTVTDTDNGNGDSCTTCGNAGAEYSDHPAYHTTPNLCGAYVYGYPDFPEDSPKAGLPCESSLDCELHPPENIPDGTYCCSAVGDGTCYRGVENG